MKKIYSLFLLFFVGVISSGTQAQTFSQGNQFQSVHLQGRGIAHCPQDPFDRPGSGRPTLINFSCNDVILEPSEYDYFIGPQGISADSVRLEATHANGSVREKTAAYDEKKGRTQKSVNLWVGSLLQRPLLGSGINRIRYVMSKSNQTTSEGVFFVNVEKGPDRRCPYDSISLPTANDCSNQIYICRRYFMQNNNCLP